jgi:hypothetical protein
MSEKRANRGANNKGQDWMGEHMSNWWGGRMYFQPALGLDEGPIHSSCWHSPMMQEPTAPTDSSKHGSWWGGVECGVDTKSLKALRFPSCFRYLRTPQGQNLWGMGLEQSSRVPEMTLVGFKVAGLAQGKEGWKPVGDHTSACVASLCP